MFCVLLLRASRRWLIMDDPESAAGNSSGSFEELFRSLGTLGRGQPSEGRSGGLVAFSDYPARCRSLYELYLYRRASLRALWERQDSNLRCVQIFVPSSSRPLSQVAGRAPACQTNYRLLCSKHPRVALYTCLLYLSSKHPSSVISPVPLQNLHVAGRYGCIPFPPQCGQMIGSLSFIMVQRFKVFCTRLPVIQASAAPPRAPNTPTAPSPVNMPIKAARLMKANIRVIMPQKAIVRSPIILRTIFVALDGVSMIYAVLMITILSPISAVCETLNSQPMVLESLLAHSLMYPIFSSAASASHFSLFLRVASVLATLILPLFFPFCDLMISIVCRYLVGPGGPGVYRIVISKAQRGSCCQVL